MSIKSTSRVIDYLPLAMGVYGKAAGSAAFVVGSSLPVNVNRFVSTSPNFQAGLYKDAAGHYTVAIAGTNELGDWTNANRALSTQNLAAALQTNTWDAQLSDAIRFTVAAFQVIQRQYELDGQQIPDLERLRSIVDIAGHSLGGALAELAGTFFGIPGVNIDGSGISALLNTPEYRALQAEIRTTFPELQTTYSPASEGVVAVAYSVAGVTGTHVAESRSDRDSVKNINIRFSQGSSPINIMGHFARKMHSLSPRQVLQFAYHLLVLAVLTACANNVQPGPVEANSQPNGIDADPDTLLRTVANLARIGVDALCDQAYLEKKLNIKIGVPRVSASAVTRKTTANVIPVLSNAEFSQAIYGTFSDQSKSSCYLLLQFKRNLLCDVASERVQNILGQRAQYTPPVPGGTMQGVFYKFKPISGYSSEIDLGISGAKCADGFSVSAEGAYK